MRWIEKSMAENENTAGRKFSSTGGVCFVGLESLLFWRCAGILQKEAQVGV